MAFSEVFPLLFKLGVMPGMLLATVDDSGHGSDIKSLNIPVASVTNGIVLEMHRFMNMNSTCTYHTFWQWLASLLGDNWPQTDFPTIKAVRQSVVRLSYKFNKLKKMPCSEIKDATISSFLDEPYCLPRLFRSHGKLVTLSSSPSSSASSCCVETETLMSVNKALCRELSALNIEVDSLRGTKKKLAEVRENMYAVHRNGTKKLKRRDCLIEKQTKEVCDGKKMIHSLQQKVAQTEAQVTSLKKQLDKIRHRASYWKSKCSELKRLSDDKVAEVLVTEENKQIMLRQEVEELQLANLDLCDEVEKIVAANDDIVTFENGKFTDDVRACCYELLSLNVGVRNVEAVIRSVLTNIAHQNVDRLPKKTLLCDMMVECLTIAQAQLGEQLSHDDGAFYTLQTDSTTKYGHHFETYDIATGDTTYALGIRHVFSGSAQTTFETLVEILDDLDVVRKELGKSDVSSVIITKVKNTMSDRHAAEKLFSQILSEYRADILPDIVSGWEQMVDAEREQLTRMNNFFCGLHFLVGLADATEATLNIWESTVDDSSNQGKTCSGIQRLIRTACKAFHQRGSEQAGCSTHFRTYLRHKGINKLPLASFKGNRFNILFYDAAGVYYLRKHMMHYLNQCHGDSLNRLLQAASSHCWMQSIGYY